MTNRDLIIRLIQQDLKHNHLIEGLKRAGLEGEDVLYLGILEIVSELMEVPKRGEVEEAWSKLYIGYMERAIDCDSSGKSEMYRPLAETCYKDLIALLDAYH